MELVTFNLNHGYVEALCRGMKQTLLDQEEYERCAAGDCLEDIRSSLEETAYGSLLQDEPNLSVATITRKLKVRNADEFNHLRGQSVGVAVRFIEFVRQDRMIDNLVLLMQGVLNSRQADEILDKCDPMGRFDGMRSVLATDVSSSCEDLYRCVLVDTPIGSYMQRYLEDLRVGGESDVSKILRETDLEVLRAVMKKAWIEAFYYFCKNECDSNTAEVMAELLETEADLRTLTITLNTLGDMSIDRMALYPGFGKLYPSGTLALRKAHTLREVGTALTGHMTLLEIFDRIKSRYAVTEDERREVLADGGDQDELETLEDLSYKAIATACEAVFEVQMQFGIFYALSRLREQEVRNLVWICEMVILGRKELTASILHLFQPLL